MKTISVKEAAEALGIGPRAVQYKLQNGDLKGTRTKNQYGVAEWRVWPTKEIAEALKQKQGDKDESSSDPINFAPNEGDTVEAEEVSDAETAEGLDEPTSWRQVEMERLEIMAEKLVKPLAERIEAQAVALREQEKVIEDQNRQLKLLPDLEKKAEEERKAAELRALEAAALQKQIKAMQAEKEEALNAQQKVEDLKRQMDQLRAEEAEKLEHLKAEKEAQEATIQKQLAAVTEQLEKLRKPWWKKWFMPAPEADKK